MNDKYPADSKLRFMGKEKLTMADFPKIEGMESKTRQALEITLPWPDKWLNPNMNHRYATARERKAQKDYAYYMTLSKRFGDWDWSEVAITYTFHPPDKRKRDLSNFVASMKGAEDGIAMALGVDDSHFHPQAPEWGEVTPGGKVVARLEELSNERE